MKKIIIVAALLISGCSQPLTNEDMQQILEGGLYAKPLAKLVARNGDTSSFHCTAVSVGKGLFLTSSQCLGNPNHLYGLDKQQHRAEVLKKGHSYTQGQGVINSRDANYAILHAPDLVLPKSPIASTGMKEGGEYCVTYFQNKLFWARSPASVNITPLKVCGIAKKTDRLHRYVYWGGNLKSYNGLWGAPVFNSENEIVGIISWWSEDNFQTSGVLEVSAFADEMKKILAK